MPMWLYLDWVLCYLTGVLLFCWSIPGSTGLLLWAAWATATWSLIALTYVKPFTVPRLTSLTGGPTQE